jgi:hypothetical protein
MKTTLDLPDDVMRRVKIRAASEDRKLKDVIAELLQKGNGGSPRRSGSRKENLLSGLIPEPGWPWLERLGLPVPKKSVWQNP